MTPNLYRGDEKDGCEQGKQICCRNQPEQLTSNESPQDRADSHYKNEGALSSYDGKALVTTVTCKPYDLDWPLLNRTPIPR